MEQMPPSSSSSSMIPVDVPRQDGVPDTTYEEIGEAVGELFKDWAEGTEKLMRESILPALQTIKETGKAGVIQIAGKAIQVSYDVAVFILTDPYVLLGAALFTIGGGAFDKAGQFLDNAQLKAQNKFWGVFGYAPEHAVEVIDPWQRLVYHAHNALAGGMAGAATSAILRPFVNIQKHLAEGARARYSIPAGPGVEKLVEGVEDISRGTVSEDLVKFMVQVVAKQNSRPRAVAKRYTIPAHYPPVPEIAYGPPLAIQDMTKTQKAHATRVQRMREAEEARKAKQTEMTQRRRRFHLEGEGMGRGRIGVPDPVMPYNDVGNDPYLIKSH
jgi:hypothetical protein